MATARVRTLLRPAEDLCRALGLPDPGLVRSVTIRCAADELMVARVELLVGAHQMAAVRGWAEANADRLLIDLDVKEKG